MPAPDENTQAIIDEGEISNLPAYNFYAKLSAIKAQEPLSGHTLLLENEGSREVAHTVKALSRQTFAKKREPQAALASAGQPGVTVDLFDRH